MSPPIEDNAQPPASDASAADAPIDGATDTNENEGAGHGAETAATKRIDWLPPLGIRLGESVDRADRRANGIEKPVPLPWRPLESHYGGGLWPGVHFVCAATGSGKTALTMQWCKHAAEAGVPVAYVGLEMDDLQFDLRLVAEQAGAKWSALYTGQADDYARAGARRAALDLIEKKLPLHPIIRDPMSWPASKFVALAEAMRVKYPEENGPGSRPILIEVDYLQIVGPEQTPCGECSACNKENACTKPGYDSLDIRERIGRTAYALRVAASRLNISVVIVSSIAREKYNMWPSILNAGLECKFDGNEVRGRRIANPDVLVGLGKESGEIEYSADSVSVIVRVPESYVDGEGEAVIFATAKGRATGAMWSPMHFTGFRYEQSHDDGAAVVAMLMKAAEAKKEKKNEKKQATQAKADQKTKADAVKLEQLRKLEDEVVRIIESEPGVGKADLINRVASTKHVGKDRINVAIAGCEVAKRIVVERRNERDHRHHPAGWTSEKRECAGNEIPPYPPVGAPYAPHGGRGDDPTPATPATPATRRENEANGVADANAILAKPPWES